MEPIDILISILALLIYSGPFFPLLVSLALSRSSTQRFRRNLVILVIATGLQALSFLPLVFAVAGDKPESEYLLWYPFLLGVPAFIAASIYAFIESIGLRAVKD